MARPEPTAGSAIAMVSMAAVLLIAFALFPPLADLSGGFNETRTYDPVELEGAGTFVALDDATGRDETVFKTTGFSVNLTGADDSFVESDTNIDYSTDQNWTVSFWGYVDNSSSGANMTALSLDGRLLVWYNGSTGNWSAWYFDEGSRDTYQINVSAGGDQPGNFSNLMVRANDSELRIYRNNTLGDTADINASSSVAAPINTTNWDGRLEEIRSFDEPLNSSERQSVVDSPVDGRPALNRTSRVMFDQPLSDEQIVLFSDAVVTHSNVTFDQGFAQEVMTEDTALVSGDYEWRVQGPEIKPVAGASLADAPVAYANYTYEEGKHDLVDIVGDAMVFGGVMIIVFGAGMTLVILRRL